MTRKNYPDNQDNIYHQFFGYYEKESLDTIKNIIVDTIIYDDTSLKMYVGIIYQTKLNWYYGQGFIGYRKTSASPIVLYSFQYSTITATTNSFEDSKIALRKNFFIDLRKHADYKNDSLISYKFSPIDKEFWKGMYFTKGPDIDSLYYFQTENNFETNRRTDIPPTLIFN